MAIWQLEFGNLSTLLYKMVQLFIIFLKICSRFYLTEKKKKNFDQQKNEKKCMTINDGDGEDEKERKERKEGKGKALNIRVMEV